MYYYGRGVVRSWDAAAKWWKLAAEQGNSAAQDNLGGMYSGGPHPSFGGVAQNYKTAIKWYTLAAEQGNQYAQFGLGIAHDRGEGVPKDRKTAVKWFTLAAERSDPLVAPFCF